MSGGLGCCSEVVSVLVVVQDAAAMCEGQLDPDEARASLMASMSSLSGTLRLPRHVNPHAEVLSVVVVVHQEAF